MKHTFQVYKILIVERYNDAHFWATKETKLASVNTTQRELELGESQQFQQMDHMQW